LTPSQNIKYDAMFFSRLIPEKGLYDLPIIWKQVTKKNPKAKLCVAGITQTPEFVKYFLELVNELGLNENITFLGMLEENTLINTIKSSKLTIYPSLIDAFSLVVLESLACGTPVVAYDISAIRHNFSRCNAVIRCPPGNTECMAEQTLTIIEDESLRETLSEAAKKYSSKYDWKNVVKAEKEGYFKVIDYTRARR
ncbi:MAG: glycosyltransferase, partial [Candidatus Bathyarchaeota archaeon]|nr:glycosyltransferase [Candidatus Bathyarchaeota archaeon]